MNSIVTYFKESYIELKERVTWPTMPELQKLTTIVLVSLAIITIVILIMDQLSKIAIIDMFYGNI
jgi:preprotein translocase subunit SecE